MEKGVEHVTFYSDSCGGQNKNIHVLSFFLNLVKSHKFKLIHHKFLEGGHTFLPNNRDFGLVKKKLCKRESVFKPFQINKILDSISKKSVVVPMDLQNFYTTNSNVVNRNKNEMKDYILFRQIRWFQYRENTYGCYFYKNSFDETKSF